MSLIQQRFDAGSNGAAVTSANTAGAGDTALIYVNPAGSGASVTFDSGKAQSGSLSAKLTPVSGSACYVQMGGAAASLNATAAAARCYLWLTSADTQDNPLVSLLNTSDGRVARCGVNGAGQFYVQSAGATVYTAGSAFPVGQWVRVEMSAVVGSTTGEVHAHYYLGDSTNPVAGVDAVGTASVPVNTGTANIQSYVVGKWFGTTLAQPFWVDSLAVENAGAAYLGPYAPPAPGGWQVGSIAMGAA